MMKSLVSQSIRVFFACEEYPASVLTTVKWVGDVAGEATMLFAVVAS